MWTDANAVEQEPLCAEVVTILGIMAERHRAEEVRAHTIIPVRIYMMCAWIMSPSFPSIDPHQPVLTFFGPARCCSSRLSVHATLAFSWRISTGTG
jgi:hypothetical protein